MMTTHLRAAMLSTLAAATLFFTAAAHAQFRTSIQGTVTDPSGAVIPNATLTLKDNATNLTKTATTDAGGVFTFQALPADHFTLTVVSAGFQKKVYNDLQFIPEQANALAVQLSLGQTDTVVNVDASSETALDTETSNIGATINSNQIQHLPSFNRDVFTLTQLAPGVVADGSRSATGGVFSIPGDGNQGPGGTGNSGAFATENGVQANANGNLYSNNGVSIDGISTVSAVWGGTTIITPNQDSIDNMRVVTNDYDAEDGRFAGAQTLVTSKSGTNQLHGSAYIAIHRPGLNAYNPRTIAAQPTIRNSQRYNQYGASLGGPIWKNKVFAFFSFESSPNNSQSQGFGWYETSAFRSAARSGSIAARYFGLAGNAPSGTVVSTQPTCTQVGRVEGVNCRTISGQGLDIGSPLTGALGTQDLTTDGTTNSPGIGGGLDGTADLAYYLTSTPQTTYYRQFNGRVDANVSAKDHFAFTMYWVPQGQTSYNGGARAYQNFHHDQINQATSLIWNHTFSPTLVNEARANVAGWRWNEVTSNPQAPSGLPYDSINNFGTNSIATVATFGAPLGSHLNQWTISYKDVLTKTIGRHTIKAGADFTGLHYLLDPVAKPNFGFYNIWDFLNDAPNQESGNFSPATGLPGATRSDQRENLWGAFIQDAWKIQPNMTINAGIRYSFFDALYAKQGNIPSAQLGVGTASLTGARFIQNVNMWNPQKGNFGPQFGFNWSPDYFNNKLVVRGGYGLSFNQNEVSITSQAGYNPPSQSYDTFARTSPSVVGPTGAGVQYSVSANQNDLYGYAPNTAAITTFNTAGLPTSGDAAIKVVGDGHGNLPTIYVQHYSLDVEYQLPSEIVATLGYEGSVSKHLMNLSGLNAYGVARGWTLNPLLAPDGNAQIWNNTGSSNHNALLVELKHPFSHQFTMDGQFQFAKSLDVNGSGPYYEDPYFPVSPGDSYGPSDFNISKSAKIYGLWQPVFFHGNHRWIEKIAGGWSLSGIYQWHTGFPYSPSYGIGQSLYCQNCSYQTVRPSYNHNGGNDHSNAAFINGTNFPNIAATASAPTRVINGQSTTYAYQNAYFNVPDFTNSITWSNATGYPAANVALPNRPGMLRNAFTGPGYRNIDATLAKAFGMPNSRLLGDHANLEIRADALNLFNILNLDPTRVTNSVSDPNFGTDYIALGGRTISFTARFSF